MLGLALLGFGSAGYATRSASADTTPATTSSCVQDVSPVGGFVVAGGVATINFTVGSGCADLSFVSYTMPSATYSAAEASQQVLFDSTSATFQTGPGTMTVNVPNCFFQLDFVYGAPIRQLGPAGSSNFYGVQGRLIVSGTGGTTACSTTTTSTTTTGQTTTTGSTSTETTSTGPTTTTGATTATTAGTTTTTASTPTTTTTQTFVPPPTTMTTAPSVSTATTTVTTQQTTTTSAFIPPPQTTTTTPTTTAPKRPGGPFKPPAHHRLKRARPAKPTTAPTLPFTGLPLVTIFGIGLALLLGGLLIFATNRRPLAAAAPALAGMPFTAVSPRPSRERVTRPRDYRVFVPGRGTFASIDAAEQAQLDRRWARFGSRTFGARWTPPAD